MGWGEWPPVAEVTATIRPDGALGKPLADWQAFDACDFYWLLMDSDNFCSQ